MIIIPASGATLRTAHYIHHKDQVVCLKSLVQDLSDCCMCSCDSEIPALAYLTDEADKEKNDVFSWILKVPNGSLVVATLTNLDTGLNYVITDDTYGDYYATGVLKSRIWGFIVKWYNVADVIGFGNYQMNITVSIGVDEIFNKDYPRFRLMPYTCESAHGTVRIEAWNTGYIEGGFDYRDISIVSPFADIPDYAEAAPLAGWVQQIRYYGRLDKIALPTQIDNLSDQYRNLLQVQTQISNEWNLRLDFIRTDVSKQIIYDNLLADYLLISDYNADSVDTYREEKLSLLSVESPEDFRNRSQIFNIKLADYKQDILKRFY